MKLGIFVSFKTSIQNYEGVASLGQVIETSAV